MIPKRTPGGRVVLPYERLMVVCRWVGSHFNYWIDYNGIALSIELRTKMDRTFQDFGGKKVLHIDC